MEPALRGSEPVRIPLLQRAAPADEQHRYERNVGRDIVQERQERGDIESQKRGYGHEASKRADRVRECSFLTRFEITFSEGGHKGARACKS